MTAEYDADVSLLEFEAGSINFNTYVQPICLWNSENEPTLNDGIVSGWGKTLDLSMNHEHIPKMVKAPIQTNEECFLEAKALVEISSVRTFCAGLKNGSGVCHGDSGGGHFVAVDGVYHLRGIVSSSLLNGVNCDVSRNAIYTNVLKFKEWIQNKTGLLAFSNQRASSAFGRLTGGKNVFCIFKMTGRLKTCMIGQAIASDDYVLNSPIDTAIERFDINDNRNVKFIPQNVGQKFSNLREFWAKGCELTIVQSYFFKDMGNLQKVHMQNSRIVSIEPEAFIILVNVKVMNLGNNWIETLDGQLFSKMVSLEHLHLNNNKLKVLSSTIFNIPGGQLKKVFLAGNVCVKRAYPSNLFLQMERDLGNKCKI